MKNIFYETKRWQNYIDFFVKWYTPLQTKPARELNNYKVCLNQALNWASLESRRYARSNNKKEKLYNKI